MKRVLSVALALLLVCSTLVFTFGCGKQDAQTDATDNEQQNQTADTGNEQQEDEEPAVTPDGADFDYTRENGGVTILGYKGTEKRIAIPAEINGKTVLCIQQFQSETVEYLRIPDSVQTLSQSVCNRNKTLKEVKIGNGIEIIPNYAFNECSNLERVITGNGVKTIGIRAFNNCKALKQVVLSTQLQLIKDEAFAFCKALEMIVLPNGLQQIDINAFANSGLKSITFPATMKSIGGMAFDNNLHLSSVTFEDGAQFFDQTVFQSGVSMFNSCPALKTLVIPASVTSIRAFSFTTIGNNSPSTLESIRFLGNAPTVYGLDNMPNNFVPHKEIVVYYSPDAAGWDTTQLAELYTLMPYTGN